MLLPNSSLPLSPSPALSPSHLYVSGNRLLELLGGGNLPVHLLNALPVLAVSNGGGWSEDGASTIRTSAVSPELASLVRARRGLHVAFGGVLAVLQTPAGLRGHAALRAARGSICGAVGIARRDRAESEQGDHWGGGTRRARQLTVPTMTSASGCSPGSAPATWSRRSATRPCSGSRSPPAKAWQQEARDNKLSRFNESWQKTFGHQIQGRPHQRPKSKEQILFGWCMPQQLRSRTAAEKAALLPRDSSDSGDEQKPHPYMHQRGSTSAGLGGGGVGGAGRKVSSRSFYGEYHGHLVPHLDAVHQALLRRQRGFR